MKKTFILSFVLLGGMFSAQAGPYYVGANHVNNLLQSIEGNPVGEDGTIIGGNILNRPHNDDGPTDEPQVPITTFPDMPGTDVWGVKDGCPNDGDWDNIGGVTWEKQAITDYHEDDGKPVAGGDYKVLKSIDWSSDIYSYTQKEDVDIVWVQPDQATIDLTYPDDENSPKILDEDGTPKKDDNGQERTQLQCDRKAARSVLESNELRWLESLNLSGNQFRSITIDGSDLVPLEAIDLSNNPTLTTLTLKNLPILATLDVTGCPDVVLTIDNCPEVVVTGAPATGIQASVATGSLISTANGQVIIKDALNETATIYAVDGRLVAQQKLTDETATIAIAGSGVYVVRLSNGTVQKVLVK